MEAFISPSPVDLLDLRDLTWSRVTGSINSDGAFLKASNTDKTLYYKMSAYNVSQGIYGHEAVNELLAYRIAKELCIPVPETTLSKALVSIDNEDIETHIAITKSFKRTHETRMSFENFYKSVRYKGESAESVAIRHGWTPLLQLMYLFDFLIINRDRHGANLEVLDDCGKKRLSPFFDNGLSLAVSCSTATELDAFDVMADRQVNNFIGSRSLYENLKGIPADIQINKPGNDFRERLLEGLTGVISERHMDVIWDIFIKRWRYVSSHILDNRAK